VILSEKDSYIISEKSLSYELAFQEKSANPIDEDVWINSLQKIFIKHFNKQ